MTAVIICGGKIQQYEYLKKYFRDVPFVISADSGARHCRSFGVIPDLLVGDFDSISEADYGGLKAAGTQIQRFPIEKDMTDSELAVKIAIEKGCSKIILLGAMGTRLDHSLSNLFLLKKLLDAGVEGVVADENNEVTLIKDSILLDREEGTNITLLPLAGSAKGVTTKGLYYPLTNATLEVGSSWGVSNLFSEDRAQVTVKEGYLLVIKARD